MLKGMIRDSNGGRRCCSALTLIMPRKCNLLSTCQADSIYKKNAATKAARPLGRGQGFRDFIKIINPILKIDSGLKT